MSRRNHSNLLPTACVTALLALLFTSPVPAQVWTGAELLTSGDWVEMSYAGGPSGSRTYGVAGTSLRWDAGDLSECLGASSHLNRCLYDRTFRLPLPAGCTGPFSVSYNYTNEDSPPLPGNDDNDFSVAVGSATRLVAISTFDNTNNPSLVIETLGFTDLADPDFDVVALVASGGSASNPVGNELSVEGTFDLSAGSSWDVTATVSSTSAPTPITFSGTTTTVPSAGEQLYLFLVSGDRSEQYLFSSITLTGCSANSAPTAEAGPNQSIHAGQTVFLDGTGSTDLETDTADLTYAWSFLSQPAGSTAAFSDATSSMPSFVADQLGGYQIELTVTDEGGLSDSDQVTVTSENVPPQAEAGPDAVAIVGSLVTLDGGASSDADGDPLSYAWTLDNAPTGSTAVLVDANTQFPSITPDLPGAYTLRLVVNDGFASSLPDFVTVTAITAEEFALEKLMEINNFVADLPDSSFDKKQDRKNITNEIAKTIDKIQKGQNDSAVHFIDKLIERTDGCELRGTTDLHGGPDKHDKVVPCPDQLLPYDCLVAARDALDPCTGVICEPLDQCHVAGTCTDGFCSDPIAPDGTACDDGDFNSVDDVCTGGICTGCVSDNFQSAQCPENNTDFLPCTLATGDAGVCVPQGVCMCEGGV